MKWICVMVMVCVSLFANAQKSFDKTSFIEPYALQVTTAKTTSLVFPFAISSVDRGSASLLVQRVKGADHILQVKAGMAAFTQTNLTVVTGDGKLYSFVVDYACEPAYLTVNLGLRDAMPENPLRAICMAAVLAKNNASVDAATGKATLAVQGFYIDSSFIFCKLRLENRAAIAYDIEQLRFYLRDSRQAKRTASQENEIRPDYVYGDTGTLAGGAARQWVVALPKFTIPDGKYLFIEMLEHNGGRHFALRVKNRKLLRAKTI